MTRTEPAFRFFKFSLAAAAVLALGIAASLLPVQAESLFGEPVPESAAPPPPQFTAQNLLLVDAGNFSSLRLGVDPASLSLGSDGVVRYVLVAVSASGNASGLYEGIRCTTAETKLYARFNADTGWVSVKDPQWRSLYEAGPSKHTLKLARSGVCVGASANSSVEQIIKDLQGETKHI